MTDIVAVAFITSGGIATPLLTAQFLAWRSANKKLVEIHQVVNSRLDAALEKIAATEAEVRTLRQALTDMVSNRPAPPQP